MEWRTEMTIERKCISSILILTYIVISLATFAQEKEKSSIHAKPTLVGGMTLNITTPEDSQIELGIQQGPLYIALAQTAYSTKDSTEDATGVQKKTNATALKAEYTAGEIGATGYGIGAGVFADNGKSDNKSNDGWGFELGVFTEHPLFKNTLCMNLNLLSYEKITPGESKETVKAIGNASVSYRVRL